MKTAWELVEVYWNASLRKASVIGAVTHTIVKGLSRGKFTTGNFYADKLYQGDS